MRSIKDMVKGNKKVRFTFYRDRQLFYQTECGFEFPVPIDRQCDLPLPQTKQSFS